MTGKYLISYQDVGPILKNIQKFLNEDLTVQDKKQLKKLAKNNMLTKANDSAKIDFQMFKRNLELVFGTKTKVGVASLDQKGVMAVRKVRLTSVQLVNLKSLFRKASKPYNKKHLDGTHKLVRAITDRDLVMMIPKMEAEENAGINITFNTEQLKHIFALIRDATVFMVDDFLGAVADVNDSKEYPKDKFNPFYYTEKDRYGALLIMSKLQHKTLRGLFKQFSTPVNNSRLLNAEQFPKFLRAMNASTVIPWELKERKDDEEDEFGDAVLLAITSNYISYFQLTNVMLPRLFLQAESNQDTMTVREIYLLYQNKRDTEAQRGSKFNDEDLTDLAVKLGLSQIAPDFMFF